MLRGPLHRDHPYAHTNTHRHFFFRSFDSPPTEPKRIKRTQSSFLATLYATSKFSARPTTSAQPGTRGTTGHMQRGPDTAPGAPRTTLAAPGLLRDARHSTGIVQSREAAGQLLEARPVLRSEGQALLQQALPFGLAHGYGGLQPALHQAHYNLLGQHVRIGHF